MSQALIDSLARAEARIHVKTIATFPHTYKMTTPRDTESKQTPQTASSRHETGESSSSASSSFKADQPQDQLARHAGFKGFLRFYAPTPRHIKRQFGKLNEIFGPHNLIEALHQPKRQYRILVCSLYRRPATTFSGTDEHIEYVKRATVDTDDDPLLRNIETVWPDECRLLQRWFADDYLSKRQTRDKWQFVAMLKPTHSQALEFARVDKKMKVVLFVMERAAQAETEEK